MCNPGHQDCFASLNYLNFLHLVALLSPRELNLSAWLKLGLKYIHVLACGKEMSLEEHLPQCFKTQARSNTQFSFHLTSENLVTWPHLLQGSLAAVVYLDGLVSCPDSMTMAEGEEDFK